MKRISLGIRADASFFRRGTNDASRTTGERDSPASLDSDTSAVRGFVRLIRYLRLNESKQALVFLRGSKEFESDAPRAYGSNHPGHFKRRFTIVERQLQVEDIVRMDLGFALDNTTAHREVEYGSFTANFSSGEREIKSNGNPEMFTSINRMVMMAIHRRGARKRWLHEGQ